MPHKRTRRTSAQLDNLLGAVLGILAGESGQISIRHLFYRLVSLGTIEKTDKDYQGTIGHLSKWRRAGLVPYSAFSDSTRWYHGSQTYSGIESFLQNTVDCYRKNFWEAQPVHLEVWCEKLAICPILLEEAEKWRVPVFTCRGFTSLTSLANAAETFRRVREAGKRVVIAYFGDHDPSGAKIDKSAAKNLREDFGVELEFNRLAVLSEQILEQKLPTRPSKGGSHSKGWEGECVEIDAMAPRFLRQLVEDVIRRHIDPHTWRQMQAAEALERESLNRVAARLRGEGAA